MRGARAAADRRDVDAGRALPLGGDAPDAAREQPDALRALRARRSAAPGRPGPSSAGRTPKAARGLRRAQGAPPGGRSRLPRPLPAVRRAGPAPSCCTSSTASTTGTSRPSRRCCALLTRTPSSSGTPRRSGPTSAQDAPRDPGGAPATPLTRRARCWPVGLTDRWLTEFPNLYADLSAGSGLGGPDPRSRVHSRMSRGATSAQACSGLRIAPAATATGALGPGGRAAGVLRRPEPARAGGAVRVPRGLRGDHRRERPPAAEPVAACRCCRPRAVQRCGRPRRAPSTAPKTAWRHTCCAAVRGR